MEFSEKMAVIEDALQAGLATIEALALENTKLATQLERCAWRNRYDGDLFHDQGIETRMEAAWKEYYAAMDLLREIGWYQDPSQAKQNPQHKRARKRMSEYQDHMQMIHSMEGWNYPETAPMNKVVTVMDHAGNQCQAIRDIGGWRMKSFSSIMDGQRVTPRKWKS